jgi:hypothetical protein
VCTHSMPTQRSVVHSLLLFLLFTCCADSLHTEVEPAQAAAAVAVAPPVVGTNARSRQFRSYIINESGDEDGAPPNISSDRAGIKTGTGGVVCVHDVMQNVDDPAVCCTLSVPLFVIDLLRRIPAYRNLARRSGAC